MSSTERPEETQEKGIEANTGAQQEPAHFLLEDDSAASRGQLNAAERREVLGSGPSHFKEKLFQTFPVGSISLPEEELVPSMCAAPTLAVLTQQLLSALVLTEHPQDSADRGTAKLFTYLNRCTEEQRRYKPIQH